MSTAFGIADGIGGIGIDRRAKTIVPDMRDYIEGKAEVADDRAEPVE